MWKWIVVAVLAAHGAAHLVGVMGSLFGREMEGISGRPTLAVGSFEKAFAVLWLVALVAFLAAALGLGLGNAWWRPVALAAVAVSMVPVAVWWDDAWRGAVLNTIVVVAVIVAPRLTDSIP